MLSVKRVKYDYLVPISGGGDSISTLYNLVRKYKMRVLVFNYDNGFVVSEAKLNIKNALERLNVDYVSSTSSKNLQRGCLRTNLVSWLKKPDPFLLPMLCVGCRRGYTLSAYRVAKKYGIPLLVMGGSSVKENVTDFLLKNFSRVRRKIEVYKRVLLNPGYFFSFIPENYIELLPGRLRIFRERTFEKSSNIRSITYYSHVPWDEKKIISTIKRELNWTKMNGFSNPWRFDCKIHFLLDYLFVSTIGISESEILLSNMIREGMISRQEALKRLELLDNDEIKKIEIINRVLEKLDLGLTVAKISQVLTKFLKQKNNLL